MIETIKRWWLTISLLIEGPSIGPTERCMLCRRPTTTVDSRGLCDKCSTTLARQRGEL